MTGNDGEVPGVGGQVEEVHAQGLPSDKREAYRKVVFPVLLSGLLLLAAEALALFVPRAGPLALTWRMTVLEDLPLTGLLLLTLAAALGASRLSIPLPGCSRRAVLAIALGAGLFCYAGHYLVLSGYDLTRDEQMVTFDAWIYRHGRLAWPLPASWQAEAAALDLTFMHEVAHPRVWVSTYLPGNALLHALFAMVGDQALTGPAMTALAIVLVWSCARKIWPDDRETAAVAAILLAVSGQVLLGGMTTYAMSAHLAFNLAWLRLFLADRRAADLAAVAVGFAATGLHQLLFHPLFAAPFMLLLLIERRWDRLALFIPAYLAIGLFWASWPEFVRPLVAVGSPGSAEGGGFLLSNLLKHLNADKPHLALMAANLARFVTWQHVALLPLMLAAWPSIRANRLAAALAVALVLPIGVIGLVVPWQGNGFGYRYVHPVLGNAVLLAGFGWRVLAPACPPLRVAFLGASLAMLVLVLPVQAWMAHGRYDKYARLRAAIDASGADYVVLADGSTNLLTNAPDLARRPVMVDASAIADATALSARLCRKGTVVGFGSSAFLAARARLAPDALGDARLARVRNEFEAGGCRTMVLK